MAIQAALETTKTTKTTQTPSPNAQATAVMLDHDPEDELEPVSIFFRRLDRPDASDMHQQLLDIRRRQIEQAFAQPT